MSTDKQIEDYESGLPDLPPTPEPPESLEEIPQYRFKTEQEFIEEFGQDWRRKLDWTTLLIDWSMDYLLGEILEPGIAEAFHKYPIAQIKIDGWIISKEMITDKPLK